MNAGLPRLVCRRAYFGELAADPAGIAWRGADATPLHDAVTGGVPQQRSWVRAAWSADEWRVLFECDDRDPWATLTERDAKLFEEETVEIFVDPIGNLEGYYELETNPLGAILDIVFRKSRSGYKGDWAWDCEGLRVMVRRTEAGWNAEFAIPFASLPATPKPGTIFRANFCRIDRPSRDGSLPRELTAWSPPMRETFHTPERFGFVEFAD
jgi:hypothetical protein